MADTSYGYPGSIDAAGLAKWVPNVGAAQYFVTGANDAKVTLGSGDRGVSIRSGTVGGDGILDIFNGNTNLNLASVGSGSRWDMLVCRRTWSSTPGASTSNYTIIQGSATKGLPARNNNKGVQSDQPIALCRVTAGQTQVQEIVDLRCWAHNGGLYAKDELVKGYLDEPGTHLTIGDKTWIRTVSNGVSSDSVAWVEAGGANSINLYNRGSQMRGNPSVSGTQGFLIQAGESFVSTDSNGFGKITWPTPFPNGVLTVQLMSSDDTLFNDANLVIPGSNWGAAPANKTFAVFNVYGASGGIRHKDWPNKTLRVTWFAIGY